LGLTDVLVAQALDLAGITDTVGYAVPSRFVEELALSGAEGSESEMPAPSGLITRPQQNQVAHAASPPTFDKFKAGSCKKHKRWRTPHARS